MRSRLCLGVLVLAFSCQRVFDNPWDPLNYPYTVVYRAPEATSGTVPVDGKRYKGGQSTLVQGNPGGLRRSGMTLDFWEFASTSFRPGESLGINGDVILSAVWKESGKALAARTATTAPNSSTIYDVALGPDGSIYAVGTIYGTSAYNFGAGAFSGPYTGANALILKIQPNLTVAWAKSLTTGPHTSVFFGVTVGPDGGVYACGYQYGTGTFNYGNSKTAAGTSSGSNGVVVKYNASGDAQWVRVATAGGKDTDFRAVAVSAQGLVAAVGSQEGTTPVTWATGITTQGSGGTWDMSGLVVVFDAADGNPVWADILKHQTTSSTDSRLKDVAFSPDGQTVFVGGHTNVDAHYRSVSVRGGGNSYSLFVLKLWAVNGDLHWVAKTQATSLVNSNVGGIALAPSGNVLVTGSYYRTTMTEELRLGGLSLSKGVTTKDHFYLAELTPEGTWSRAWTWNTDTNGSESFGVATDRWGNIFVAGYIKNGTFPFGDQTITGFTSTRSVFLLKINPAGTLEWLRTHELTSSPDETSLRAVAVNDQHAVVGGYLDKNKTYGLGNSINAQGLYASGHNAVVAVYQR